MVRCYLANHCASCSLTISVLARTIMAGLLIKELLIRGDLERCLIVAPAGLVEQWQEELAEEFGLQFDLLTKVQVEASVTGNPFC
jgi:hypothetical protein